MSKSLAIFAAAVLAAGSVTSVSASSLDLSNGSFDTLTDTFVFDEVVAGVDLIIEPTNGTTLVSQLESLNGTLAGDNGSFGGRINMRQGKGGADNTVDLLFRFVDNADNPFVFTDFEVGFYDLDGFAGEIIETVTPASVTVTTSTATDVTVTGTSNIVAGANVFNVPNVTDFNNLTFEQEDAGALFYYGDVSEFTIRLTITSAAINQRNFEFGNLSFNQDTTTFPPIGGPPPAPVPVPASALLLGAAVAGLGFARRFKG